MNDEYDAEELLEAERSFVRSQLENIRNDPMKLARLHSIERMLVEDLINHPMRCRNCLRWAKALIEKASREDKS